MGIFSKIAKGIQRGTSSGFASLGQNLEDERSTRRKMRTTAFGGIEAQALKDATTGLSYDPALIEMAGIDPDYEKYYGQRAAETIQRDNEDLVSSTDRYLDKTATDKFGQPTYDLNEWKNITAAIQQLSTKKLENEQYIERQGSDQSPHTEKIKQNLSILEARIGQLNLAAEEMAGGAASQFQRNQIGATYQAFKTPEELSRYESYLKEQGVEGQFYDAIIESAVEDRIEFLAGQGSFPAAFRLAKGQRNEMYLTERVNNIKVEQQYPALSSTIKSIVTSAKSQSAMASAYSSLQQMKDGAEKEELVKLLQNRSQMRLENRQREYVGQEFEMRSVIVQNLNQMSGSYNAELDRGRAAGDALSLLREKAVPVVEGERQPIYHGASPEVIRELQKQMDAMYPSMAGRKITERQLRSHPGMRVADVEAIKGLQQVNVGKGYDEVVFNLNNSEYLTLREKIETKQVMDQVGEELGFDVLRSKVDDAAMLNKIHAGVPSFANNTKVFEDGITEAYTEEIDDQYISRPRSGTLLNTFYPNAIQLARADLEVREMTGLIPVGGTDRIVKRLTAKYLGDEGMAKMTGGDAETAAPAAPAETDPLPYKRYGRESAEALGIRGFGDEVKSILQSIGRTVDRLVDADISSFALKNEDHMSTDEALNRKYAAAFKLHRSDWLKYKDAIDEEHSGGSRNSGVGDFSMREQRMGFNR